MSIKQIKKDMDIKNLMRRFADGAFAIKEMADGLKKLGEALKEIKLPEIGKKDVQG